MKLNLTRCLRILVVGLFLLVVLTTHAQQMQFENGIARGVVKVKFKQTMEKTLQNVRISTRNNKLTTGISSFDKVSSSIKASNMERLFPYDPQIEDKLRKHGLHLWYVVKMDEGVNPLQAVKELRQLAEVSVVEAEFEKVLPPTTYSYYTPTKADAVSNSLPFNDPMLASQWHYQNTGQTGYPNGTDVNLFKAWETVKGNSNIIVSIHDQGVDTNHEDLKANLWVNAAEANGKPGVDDDDNGYIDDIHGFNYDTNRGAIDAQSHGTHVAGTISAVNNNAKGVSGVAGGSGNNDGVKLMSLQVMGGGSVDRSYIYAAKMGAVISQNSWGYSNPEAKEESVADAIKYFIAEAGSEANSPIRGGIVIFAAGNKNSNADWYPGRYDYVLSVTALGPSWKKAVYSNFAPWADIAAPGGDSDYGMKNAILSTLPNNKYGYNEGTSMACPHVSGIAALVVANSDHKMTNVELWNKLVTGVKNIDTYNPQYIGMLGSGAIDTYLAIQNDKRIAPAKINNLSSKGVSQEFVVLEWTVPKDEDDVQPHMFEVYYSKDPITADNLNKANKEEIKNNKNVGEVVTCEIGGLLGTSNYYFTVIGVDRWSNKSELSNILVVKTNSGPGIDVDAKSINLSINTLESKQALYPFKILNDSAGVLRWEYFIRNKSTQISASQLAGIKYPTASRINTSLDQLQVGRTRADEQIQVVEKATPTPLAFQSISKYYYQYTIQFIGDIDKTLPISSATKFVADEEGGFNLTKVAFDISYTRGTGALVVEIYKGKTLEKENLIYAQEHDLSYNARGTVNINLNEQIYFEKGSEFFVVLHVPSGNLYPIGIGFQKSVGQAFNCYYSDNVGAKWHPLPDVLNSNEIVWSTKAISDSPHVSEYIALDPKSGEVAGKSNAQIQLNADGSKLINGIYKANVVLTSNDAKNREFRIPVDLTVSGQQADVVYPDIVDFGSVFVESEKALDILLNNQGYGLVKGLKGSLDNPQFSFVSTAPNMVGARDQATVRVKFKPTTSGNVNGILKLSNGTQTYTISLFGVGGETSKVKVEPLYQSINNLNIGDNTTSNITVTNIGAYPLKYFIPGFDSAGVSKNWPVEYHSYGYAVRSSKDALNPLVYEFNDISSTGIDITEHVKTNDYKEIQFGFDFPFYGENKQKVYLTKNGFVTFDTNSRPVNVPRLKDSYGPNGLISPFGTVMFYTKGGNVYYKIQSDRLIIQYNTPSLSGFDADDNCIIQMVLFANGNIRFYYKKLPADKFLWEDMAILIEDMQKKDGISILKNGTLYPYGEESAIGIDYPGPNIITNIKQASGILAPGTTSTIKVDMATASLAEGVTNRYVNIISNDPQSVRVSPLISLNVVGGGTTKVKLTNDTLDFGNIYIATNYKKQFFIKNTGTKTVSITGITTKNNLVAASGEMTIEPGINEFYDVVPNTSTARDLSDEITISYADGSSHKVYVFAKIKSAPMANADLSLLSESLGKDQIKSHPFEITNTGASDLEVLVDGGLWYKFKQTSTPNVLDYDYAVYTHNADEPTYNWIDIVKTGVHKPISDYSSDSIAYWHKVTNLKFPIKFYGVEYDTLKIGDNGIIALNGYPQPMFFPERMPFNDNKAYIAPMLMGGGFDANVSQDLVGVFYQQFEDKIVISWERMFNFFWMGDPISSQVVIYKDGTMKFQYKVNGEGTDATSNTAQIGIQRPNGTALMLSKTNYLNHGKGLAYLFSPSVKQSVAANSKLTGEIVFDASNIYGGTFTDSLKISTNDPNKGLMKKPLKVTTTGVAVLSVPDAIDFGEVIIDQETGVVQLPLALKNIGESVLEFTWAKMDKGNQSLTQLLSETTRWGKVWTPIENIFKGSNTPKYSARPNEVITTMVQLTPSAPGKYEDVLILTTNGGEKRITLKGEVFYPAVLGGKQDSINVSINTPNQKETGNFQFDNKAGDASLRYNLAIDYKRIADIAPVTQATLSALPKMDISNVIKDAQLGNVLKNATKATRTLELYPKDSINVIFGFGGAENFVTATRYNGGATGFNLSEVGTYFMGYPSASGTVDVEIKAGANIYNAKTIGRGSIAYTRSKPDDVSTVQPLNVKFDTPIEIYPNEDFYVLFSYPLLVEKPQGSIRRGNYVKQTPGTFFFMFDGYWYDLHTVDGGVLKNMAWYMYASEENGKKIGWLDITSPKSGTIVAGDSTTVNISFDGSLATRGDQVANITIKSNDLDKPVVSVPVKLHLNEAPILKGIANKIYVNEADSLVVEYTIFDKEANTVSLEISTKPDFMTHSIEGSKLTMIFEPDYGLAGTHDLKIKATDQYNASTEYNIVVDVLKTNRAPSYIGKDSKIVLSINEGKLVEYNINDFFKDVDGDTFTFEVATANSAVFTAYASNNNVFILKPATVGTAKLNFVVTDVHGAIFRKAIDVEVISCIDPASVIAQKWNSTLVANNKEGKYTQFQWYKNGQPIAGATKQYYSDPTNELDFTALYHVQLTTANGTAVSTCTMKPVKKEVGLRAYPNPVKGNGMLKIDVDLPNIDNESVYIQVVNLAGQVVKTIVSDSNSTTVQMPGAAGTYLVKVKAGEINKVFNVIVE